MEWKLDLHTFLLPNEAQSPCTYTFTQFVCAYSPIIQRDFLEWYLAGYLDDIGEFSTAQRVYITIINKIFFLNIISVFSIGKIDQVDGDGVIGLFPEFRVDSPPASDENYEEGFFSFYLCFFSTVVFCLLTIVFCTLVFAFQVGSAIKAVFIRKPQGGTWKDTLISKRPL